MKNILLLTFMFLPTLAKGEVQKQTEVYSGYISSEVSDTIVTHLPVRLYIIKTAQKHLALLKINMGSFSTTEYATYVYQPTDYQQDSDELILTDYENSDFLSLPRLFLNRTKSGWSGTVQSLASKFFLNINLVKGWESNAIIEKESVTPALSGHYRANQCYSSNTWGGSLKHKGMYLFPKRGSSDDMLNLGIAEAGMKMQNYVGVLTTDGASANRPNSQIVGNNLRSGRYNFYEQTLEINFANALLFCSRLRVYPELAENAGIQKYGANDLWCRSRFFKNNGCHYSLVQTFSEAEGFKDFEAKPAENKPDFSHSNEDTFTPVQICQNLAKRWNGQSNIAGSNKSMATTIEMVGHLTEAAGCRIYAQSKQYLQRSRPIFQRYKEIEITEPTKGNITLLPYDHSDMLLSIPVHGLMAGDFKADWFSTIFGFVGDLQMKNQRDSLENTSGASNAVRGLAGFYYLVDKDPNAKVQWATRLFNAGIDVNFLSADPSRMFAFNGYLEAYSDLPAWGSNSEAEEAYGRAVQMVPMKTLYYDYFTNRFLMSSQNKLGVSYWYGSTTKKGSKSYRTGVPFSKEFPEKIAVEEWILSK